MPKAKPPRTEPWNIKIQLGNWVGHVSLPAEIDAKTAHKMILDVAAKAAEEITEDFRT